MLSGPSPSMKIVIVILSMVVLTAAELAMTVTPSVLELGLTPSFTVNCALIESEEVKIVSITLSRQTIRKDGTLSPKKELLATVDAMTPRGARRSLAYPQVTVLGEITTLESEMGSYLTIVWPTPSVDDFGVYTCDAKVVGEYGELLPLTAQARISSSAPGVDRLLIAIRTMEHRLEGFNMTLAELQDQILNISALADQREQMLLAQLAATPATTATTTTAALTTTAAPETTVKETTTTEETTTEATTPELPAEPTTTAVPTPSPLDTLLAAMELLTAKLDAINETLQNLEEKVSSVEAAVEPVNATEAQVQNLTQAVEVLTDHVETFNNTVTDQGEKLDPLVTLVEVLTAKLEALNATLAAQEEKLETLATKVEEYENETETVTDKFWVYVVGNSVYLLVKGEDVLDSAKAQAACQTKLSYLAEVNDQAELDTIVSQVGFNVTGSSPVLVGGQRVYGSVEWIWQDSLEPVSFFAWAAGEPAMASLSSDCIALKTAGGVTQMVSTACQSAVTEYFFLCERVN